MTPDPNIVRKLRAFQERMGWLEPDDNEPDTDEGPRLDTSEKAFENPEDAASPGGPQ